MNGYSITKRATVASECACVHSFDLEKKHIEIALSTPELRLASQYEMDGKILVVPIRGKGDGSVNMSEYEFPVRDVDIAHTLDYELVTKEDGLEYMEIVNSNLVYKPMRMQIYLDNLFNGDKALSDNTNRFLNENWEGINAEFGPAIAQAIGEVGKQVIANCMAVVAYKDIFPETV
ncbi:hypothetical protein PR048_027335 [Dryococelus australis]|uniref:Protein takeout n=1 Tax=Dryococelus australis TaxID=614101 RepID=A0ABQ9GGA9_9NEOP|nr:hypothetical protein PR048_027335 [Dryococelus australis]